MERRFAEGGLSDRVSFIEAVDGLEVGVDGDEWTRSARGCFASHLEVTRRVASDPAYAQAGAIVCEDDILLHRDFAELSEAALANLPAGAEQCHLAYLLAPPNPDLVWAGRDPALHNLCAIEADAMWGSHCYWLTPARAERVLEVYGDMPFDEYPCGTERFTIPAQGFASWPVLALQEGHESTIRPDAELNESHRRGQRRWPLADYLGAGEAESDFTFTGSAKPTIGLCMIVRDEAEIIGRCFDSVAGLVDTWTIVDTGSEDGTPQLVEELLAGTPGTLHRSEWRDFGHNRSELMQLARGTADYLLLVDADMTVGWRGPLPELEADAYELRHKGDPAYWIPRLVRGDLDWRYVGSTHEYLALDGEFSREPLRALVIEHHGDGGSRAEKYERDRALLESELQRDPQNDRATFYLAQTLRDMAHTEEAIALYRRRIELGGWDEEVFYSAFQVAMLSAESDPAASIPLFMEAFELRPTRAEPLHEASYVCRRLGDYGSAYDLAKRALAIPEPPDILFVGRRTYVWGSQYELALAAHETSRYEEAIRLYEGLLDGRELPRAIERSVRENLRRVANRVGGSDPANRLTEPALAELVPSARIAEIKLEVEPAWPQFNPSIARDGDGFQAIVRTSNYTLDRGVYSVFDGSGRVRTINYLAKLGPDLALREVEPLRDLDESDLTWHDFAVQGWEDCRLFQVGGQWYATATSRELDPDGVCKTVLLTLDGARIAAARVLEGPDPHRHEKNWMPFVSDGELLFVYSSGPTIVTRVDPAGGDPEPVATNPAPDAAANFRGGSQGVAVEGGALFCVHEALDFGGPRRYLHRWVRFDSAWVLDAASPRFHFADQDVEICTGLARRGTELIASFGVGDHSAAIAVMNEAEVIATLQPAGDLRAGN